MHEEEKDLRERERERERERDSAIPLISAHPIEHFFFHLFTMFPDSVYC